MIRKAPLSRCPASMALVYRALRAEVEAWRRAPDEVPLRFFLQGAAVVQLGRWLPREPTLGSYLRRLRRQLKGRTFLLVASDLQRFEPRLQRSLEPIIRKRPGIGVEAGLFLGDYATTAFGVHRDPVDVRMWMLRGRKVMRLWKGNALTVAQLERYGGDYRAYLGRARTVALRRGDSISWRAGVWHIGESQGLSASLNLAFRTRGGTFAYPAKPPDSRAASR